jgi:LPXTG-site transpeptidase (sortase) family protein
LSHAHAHRSSKPRRWRRVAGAVALVLGVVGLVLILATRLGDNQAAPTVAGAPTRIAIPSVHIESDIIPIGVKGRVVQVPTSIHIVGWDNQTSKLPVKAGSSLLVGHRDSVSSEDGIFRHLGEVKIGQEVQVWTGNKLTVYHVRSVQQFPKNGLPTWVDAVTGPAKVVLVTCGGGLATGPDGRLHWDANIVVVAT